MSNIVDLVAITDAYLHNRLLKDPADILHTYGKPQVVFDTLRLDVLGETNWKLRPVQDMKIHAANFDAFQKGLYSEVVTNTFSVLGNSFTIRKGLVKGLNKSLTVPVCSLWQSDLGQTEVDIYPGQKVTNSKQRLQISLGTSHQLTRPTRSIARVDIKEKHLQGTITFKVLLSGNVFFLQGSGSPIRDIHVAQIVHDVGEAITKKAKVEYRRNGLPDYVYWTMEINADILCDFQENLTWS